MTNATVPDSHAELLQAPLATLATVGSDGRPQLSTVWFLADDGKVRFSLNTTRQKVKNLQVNPAIGVHIQDTTNPIRYLELRGDARIEPDDDYVFAERLGAKYGGIDLRAMDAGGPGRRVVVTVEPSRVNAIDLAAG
jgi:PPOX class probable F420-dependent enzyme